MANTGTVVYKQPDLNITKHVPQSAASNIIQQNETCTAISLKSDYIEGVSYNKKFRGKPKWICFYHRVHCQVRLDVFIAV